MLTLIVLLSPLTATDTSYMVFAVFGWFLCGVVSFVLLGAYRGQVNRLMAEQPYIESSTQTLTSRGTLVLGVVGVLLGACEIALWVSKL